MSNIIRSIQTVSITIGSGATTNNAVIGTVTAANTIIIYNGATSNVTDQTSGASACAYVQLTTGSLVTATRAGSAALASLTINCTVVEFAGGVNSIQQGFIAIGGGATSNTATISAVGANAFVLHLGSAPGAVTTTEGDAFGSITLTNSTTVTARCESGINAIIGYMVVDLDATLVNTVQALAVTHSDTSSTKTATITGVVPGNTLVFFNGIDDTGGHGAADGAYTYVLTNATTVTFTKNGTANTGVTLRCTVVQFAVAALVGSVQRGTKTLSAASSGTATISAIDTMSSLVNWGGFNGADANYAALIPTLALTNATTVTAALNAAGTINVAYEVIQFDPPTTLDPAECSASILLSNANLSAAIPSGDSNFHGCRSTTSKSSGKVYFEFHVDFCNNGAGGDYVFTGIGTAASGFDGAAANGSIPGYVDSNGAVYDSFGLMYFNDGDLTGGVAVPVASTGDIIGVAIDVGNHLIYFSYNGTWVNSSNPSANTGGSDYVTTSAVFAWVALYRSGGAYPAVTMNFGNTSFTYAVPTGFVAWDTAAPTLLPFNYEWDNPHILSANAALQSQPLGSPLEPPAIPVQLMGAICL